MSTHLNFLHLQRRKDRYENIIKQVTEQGISFFSIHEGIDEKVNTKKAVCQGHKAIVQSAKNNGLDRCLIAEDDICFTAKGAWQYFLSQIPESYDLFFGLIYAGQVEENRVMNGMSGTHTLYSVHQRFYDFFLSQPDNVHVDRNLGQFAFEKEYYVCSPMVVTQMGGWSDNLRMNMTYEPYLIGKKLFGVIT